MKRVSLSRNQVRKYWAAILCAILLAGCAGAKLISDYDEVTDKSLMTIQQKTDDFIETLLTQSGTNKAAFSKHQAFYSDIAQQLRRLEFRVNAIPKNEKTLISSKRSAWRFSAKANARRKGPAFATSIACRRTRSRGRPSRPWQSVGST